MNARERFFTTMRHEEPDRVPYHLLLYAALIKGLEERLPPGTDHREHFDEAVYIIPVDYPEYANINLQKNEFPLPTVEAVEKAAREVERVKEMGRVACNGYFPGIFEHFKKFTSDEYALTHMMLEPEDAALQITRITDWLRALFDRIAPARFDICFNGDDIGTQKSTIMGLDSYREFYKPNHIKLIESIKASNPQAAVAFHCCGHLHTIVPEWIEIGADIIHSVQPEANDLRFLKERFGRDIVFWGGIGLQTAFSEDAIRETLAIMSPGGGYIAATSNYTTDEVPIETILRAYAVLTNQ